MPPSAESTRLFYDSGCGPCTFFARAFQGVSRTRFAVRPLDGTEANEVLGGLPAAERYGAFHFLVGNRRFTGADAMPPLVTTAFGPAVGRVSAQGTPMGRLIQRTYLWFWTYRRTRGCAAGQSD